VWGIRNAYKETSVQKNLNKTIWKRKHTREVNFMGERYWITGVQLSLFTYLKEKPAIALVNEIVEKQFIGNYPSDKEQKEFEKKIKGLK
jgi:hypothetical protein